MIVGIPKEILEHEGRVAALPDEVAEYVKMGFTVLVETKAGDAAFQSDEKYAAAGAEIVPNVADLWERADLVLKVKQPWYNAALGRHEAELVREGTMLITFLHPAAPDNHDMVRTLAQRRVTALTMDGIRASSAPSDGCSDLHEHDHRLQVGHDRGTSPSSSR